MSTASYFIRTGPTTFEPTRHAVGAWSKEDHHFSPVAGLMLHVIEQSREDTPTQHLQLARMSFDILGRIPLAEVDIRVEVLRPGRTIELVQATLHIRDRSVITARAWYLIPTDTTEAAASEITPLPAPENCPVRDLGGTWSGGFMTQLQAREALTTRPGRGAAWLTSPTQLVQGEKPVEIAEYFARIDTANGVAVRQSPEQWMFPNVDLTVHLFRKPVGTWTGLDTRVDWGTSGIGITSSTLHDVDGPVGRVEQSLTVRRL